MKATFEQRLDFGATFEQLIRVLEQLLSNFLRKLEQLVDNPRWDAGQLQGYPQALSLPVPINTTGWREAL